MKFKDSPKSSIRLEKLYSTYLLPQYNSSDLMNEKFLEATSKENNKDISRTDRGNGPFKLDTIEQYEHTFFIANNSYENTI